MSAKNSYSETATAVLTKQEGQDTRSRETKVPPVIPVVQDSPEFRQWLSNILQELNDLRQEGASAKMRLDKFIVDPGTGAVTFPI